MADVRTIIVDVQTDTTSLDELDRQLKETARKFGVNEQAVMDVNREIKGSVQSSRAYADQVRTLEKREQQLAIASKKATDPTRRNRINALLSETRKRLDAATNSTRKLGNETQKAGNAGKKGIGNLNAGMSSFLGLVAGGALIGGLQGITGEISALVDESIELFDVQATVVRQLEQGIESTGGAAGRSVNQLIKQAQELQKATLFGDEETEGAQSILLTFTNIRTEIFDRTVPAILDVATKMDTDLKSAALQLGKALNDPIRGLDGLSRSGIQFSADQKKLIKTLTETGQIAKAQGLILNELERQFGGAAKAAAEAGTGGITQLENRLSDLKETIGAAIAPIREGFLRMKLAVSEFFIGFIGAADAYNQIPLEQKLLNEQTALNGIVSAITDANTSQETRTELVLQLNREYPGFLENLNAEKVTNEQLKTRLDEVNASYVRRITLQAQASIIEDEIKAQTEAFREQVKATASLGTVLETIRRQYDVLATEIGGVGIDDFAELSNLEKASVLLDEFDEKLKKIPNTSEEFFEITKTAGALAVTVTQLNLATEKYNGTQQNTAELALQLKEIEGQLATALDVAKTKTNENTAATEGLTKAQKDLQAQFDRLRLSADVELAGGDDTIAGIKILEEAAIKALESNAAFQKLRLEDEAAANALILAERQKFTGRINGIEAAEIKLKITTEETAISEQIQKETVIFQQTFLRQSRRLIGIETLSAEERKRIETDVQQKKTEAQVRFFQASLTATKDFVEKNNTEIQALELIPEDDRSEAENAELQKRISLRKKFAENIIKLEQQITDAITKNGAKLTDDEKKNLEARLAQFRSFADQMRGIGIRAGDDLTGGILGALETLKNEAANIFAAIAEGGNIDLGQTLASGTIAALELARRASAQNTELFLRQTDQQIAAIDRAEEERRTVAEEEKERALSLAVTVEQKTAIEEEARIREIEAAKVASEQRAEIEKQQYIRQQSLARGQAITGAAQAIIAVWSAPAVLPAPLDFAAKAIFSGLVANETRKQLSIINSAPGFKDGGYTSTSISSPGATFTATVGERDHTGDKVAGVAHEKEWIAPTPVIRKEGKLIQYLETVREGKPNTSILRQYLTDKITTHDWTPFRERAAAYKSPVVSEEKGPDAVLYEGLNTTSTSTNSIETNTAQNEKSQRISDHKEVDKNIFGNTSTHLLSKEGIYISDEQKSAIENIIDGNPSTEKGPINPGEARANHISNAVNYILLTTPQPPPRIGTAAGETHAKEYTRVLGGNNKELIREESALKEGSVFISTPAQVFPPIREIASNHKESALPQAYTPPAIREPLNVSKFDGVFSNFDAVTKAIKGLEEKVKDLPRSTASQNNALLGHRIQKLENLWSDHFKGRI